MTIYPEEQKARLTERMLPPQNVRIPQLSQETGIPKDTLYGWRREAPRARGLSRSAPLNGNERWRSEEKFALVVETAAMNEAERGEYCRTRGLYVEQLQVWRQTCEPANADKAPKSGASAERQADKRRIRELERELRRKEQALAETAALLVLRKKAQAIWGECAGE